MMERVAIDIDEPLQPGDLIELHFRTVGGVWLTGAQIALIQATVSKRKDFEILSWSIPESARVIFKVRVKKTNPVIVTAAVIAGVILVSGIGIWLAFEAAYKLVQAPAEPIRALEELIKQPAGALLAIAVSAILGTWVMKALK